MEGGAIITGPVCHGLGSNTRARNSQAPMPRQRINKRGLVQHIAEVTLLKDVNVSRESHQVASDHRSITENNLERGLVRGVHLCLRSSLP